VSDGNGEVVSLNAQRVERYRELPDVRSVHASNGRIFLRVGQVHTAVPALLESLSADGLTLAGLSTHGATLEDVFMALTGRQLRDA
jgi:ABC-2 type transport system ATP-binding protein